MIKKTAALLVCILLTVQFAAIPPALAAANTYYVDAVNGNDENSGLSEEQAWRSAARAAEAELASGDTVLFHAGQTFYNVSITPCSNNLTFGAYASGGRPVLCGGVKGGEWSLKSGSIYTMKAVLDRMPYLLKVGDKLYRKENPSDYMETSAGRFSYDAGNSVLYINEENLDLSAQTLIQQTEHIFYINQKKKISISGLSMIMTGGGAVSINSRESQYITVDNNEIAYTESYYSDGSGINCSGAGYSVFSNNIIHDVLGDGILLWNCTGNTVSQNKIWGIKMGNNSGGDGIQCAGKAGNAAPDNKIINNYISMKGTNVGKGCIQQENGDNAYIAGNVCLYGNFGIEANSNYGIVENNICAYQGIESGYNWCAGLYMSEEEDITGMIWRGNMVSKSQPYGFRIGSLENNVRTGFKIYNNTIYSYGCAFSSLVGFDGEVFNNIFYNCKPGPAGAAYSISSLSEDGNAVSDYNVIYPERSGCISYLGTAYDSLDVFRLVNPALEANSVMADPLLYGQKMAFSEPPAAEEFEIYSNSPAAGMGRGITDGVNVIYQNGCNAGAVQTVRADSFNVGGGGDTPKDKPAFVPGLIAYEGFNYPPTQKLEGQNGGTGFLSAWEKTSETVYEGVIGTSSLAHDMVYDTGYRAKIASGYKRQFDGIFSTGTYYISFLVSNDTGYGFSMSIGDGANSIIVRNEAKSNWQIKARTKYQTAASCDDFGLVLLKLAIGENSTSVSMWVNPDIKPGLGPAAVSDYTSQRLVPKYISFGISNSNGKFLSVDEIRAADNLEAVFDQTSPYPERFEVTDIAFYSDKGIVSGEVSPEDVITAKVDVTNPKTGTRQLELYAAVSDENGIIDVSLGRFEIGEGKLEHIEFPIKFNTGKKSCTVGFMVWENMRPLYKKTGYAVRE